ncbi:hypothetical protein [Streptomyces sp. NPDC000618]|uniref:hypothetical protein n=1 Tax=Streptomyces sp. NPDC000618 TaxID=3154265 RepID=UPI00332A4E99
MRADGIRLRADSEHGSVGYPTIQRSIGGIGRLVTIGGQHCILGVHLEEKRITDEVSCMDQEMHRANEAKNQPAGAAAPAQLAARGTYPRATTPTCASRADSPSLIKLQSRFEYTPDLNFVHEKAHAGHPLNEAADGLADHRRSRAA